MSYSKDNTNLKNVTIMSNKNDKPAFIPCAGVALKGFNVSANGASLNRGGMNRKSTLLITYQWIQQRFGMGRKGNKDNQGPQDYK